MMNQIVPFAAPAMTVSDVERVALAIAKGGLFGSKDPNAVLTLCLLAQAEGQHPAVVFRDYHIISGKPAKKAEAMLRDFINAGGKVEWHQLDDTCADATFTHPAGTARISWNHERAQKAQLAGNAMYKKYPRQMLRSRVISEGIRTVYPGATSGLYEEGEVASFNDKPVTIEAPANETVGEFTETPPIPSKVEGIHKIKQRIREMKKLGEAATDLTHFEVIVSDYETECQALCDGQHEWWTGKDRDGNEFEGIPAWLTRRRGELGQADHTLGYNMLVSCVNECDTEAELSELLNKHDNAIGELDGAESRSFEELVETKLSAFKALEVVRA